MTRRMPQQMRQKWIKFDQRAIRVRLRTLFWRGGLHVGRCSGRAPWPARAAAQPRARRRAAPCLPPNAPLLRSSSTAADVRVPRGASTRPPVDSLPVAASRARAPPQTRSSPDLRPPARRNRARTGIIKLERIGDASNRECNKELSTVSESYRREEGLECGSRPGIEEACKNVRLVGADVFEAKQWAREPVESHVHEHAESAITDLQHTRCMEF